MVVAFLFPAKIGCEFPAFCGYVLPARTTSVELCHFTCSLKARRAPCKIHDALQFDTYNMDYAANPLPQKKVFPEI